MVRTSRKTAEPSMTLEESPAQDAVQAVAEPRREPKTITVSAQVLAEALAAYAFALTACGTDSLTREGRSAFRALIGDLDAVDGVPAERHEIPAESAFWLSHDLLGTRHRRPGLTGGEVVLGQAVSQQTPELAHRLGSAAPRRSAQPVGAGVDRQHLESPLLLRDPSNAHFPQGQYFDSLNRPVGPRRTASGTSDGRSVDPARAAGGTRPDAAGGPAPCRARPSAGGSAGRRESHVLVRPGSRAPLSVGRRCRVAAAGAGSDGGGVGVSGRVGDSGSRSGAPAALSGSGFLGNHLKIF